MLYAGLIKYSVFSGLTILFAIPEIVHNMSITPKSLSENIRPKLLNIDFLFCAGNTRAGICINEIASPIAAKAKARRISL